MAKLERISVIGPVSGTFEVDRSRPTKQKEMPKWLGIGPAPVEVEGGPLEVRKLDLFDPPSPEEQGRIDEMKLPSGAYPGGGQVDGWSPLRERGPWSVPTITPSQRKVGLLPEWYTSIRNEVASTLEIMRRISPYIRFKVLGMNVRLQNPLYTFPAIVVLLVTAPTIPGPAVYNIALVPVLLMGGDVRWVDRLVAVMQPVLWPIVNTFNAVKWTAETVREVLSLPLTWKFKMPKLLYYPLFNKKLNNREGHG